MTAGAGMFDNLTPLTPAQHAAGAERSVWGCFFPISPRCRLPASAEWQTKKHGSLQAAGRPLTDALPADAGVGKDAAELAHSPNVGGGLSGQLTSRGHHQSLAPASM